MSLTKILNEFEQAERIANQWLDFQMNPLVQMVHGDPDCDACVLARQYLRLLEASSAQAGLLEALKGVVAVADRKTDEFDRAHAAIAKATGAVQ
jgi:hypothetical protein